VVLTRFTDDAQVMARAVRWGDGSYIEQKLERGRGAGR
jgi:cyclohexadieny/prephenate dehydrogenase